MTERKAGNSRLVYNKATLAIDTVHTAHPALIEQMREEGGCEVSAGGAALPVPAIERQALAAYDASDRHIPDSDLDDEQPLTLVVSTTLGEVRRIRRHHALLEHGARLAAAREKAIRDYEDNL